MEEDNILMPNYKTVLLKDVLPNPFATGKWVNYKTPEGLLEAIEIIEDEYSEYEFCQIVIGRSEAEDFVLLKLI
jgi:hypothetical protein